MSHLPDLIVDLGLILIIAGFATVIFKFLKQPAVLGYIVAGFLVSPHFVLFPSVADLKNIAIWSEVGVIILLFAKGIEFNFKKLLRVGATAGIAAIISISSMMMIGYLAGLLMGLSEIASIFFGGMLSMSSTEIIIKALGDMGLQKKRFAHVVYGVLIVEDISAILMLFVFTALASVHTAASGPDASYIIMKTLTLGVFILTCFIAGIFFIPTLLKKLKKFLTDEVLLILSVGFCIGMVILSGSLGYSAALGAFMMGAILAETIEAKRIEHLINPLKDLFGTVFFVSIGMMIVPATLVEYAGSILLITLTVIVGRIVFGSLGVLASGEGMKTSLKSGMSLAQVGEFSFIIATLGISLNVLDDFIYHVIVAVSVTTTFTTPYCIKLSEPLYDFIEKRVPSKWQIFIYGYGSSRYKTINEISDVKNILKTTLPSFLVYSSFLTLTAIVSYGYIIPFITGKIPSAAGSVLAATVCVVIMLPFTIAMTGRKRNINLFRDLWNNHTVNKVLITSLIILKFAVCVGSVMFILLCVFPHWKAWILLLSVVITASSLMIQGFRLQSEVIERYFLKNLNTKEILEGAVQFDSKKKLTNLNIHLEEFTVSPDTPIAGMTLAELNLFNRTGANIVSIERGSQRMNIPDKNTTIFPYDRLIVAATDEVLNRLMSVFDRINSEKTDVQKSQISISLYQIPKDSIACRKRIEELDIPAKTRCMIVGIDREGISLPKFSGKTILLAGDTLWLAGEEDSLNGFSPA